MCAVDSVTSLRQLPEHPLAFFESLILSTPVTCTAFTHCLTFRTGQQVLKAGLPVLMRCTHTYMYYAFVVKTCNSGLGCKFPEFSTKYGLVFAAFSDIQA